MRDRKTKRPTVFISYSQRGAAVVARALQSGLQRFAKPWWSPRALEVIRDETALGGTASLWGAITRQLDRSDWMVLVASRAAAEAKWVKRELRYWLGEKEAGDRPVDALDEPVGNGLAGRRERLLIVLVEGEIVWHDKDAQTPADFDWTRTTALPRCLQGVFAAEPLWADLRKYQRLDRSDPAFGGAVARLSEPIRGLDLWVLLSEDNRRHRQALRTAWLAVAFLALLAISTAIGAWLATVAARAAAWQREIAVAQRQAAESEALSARDPAALARAAWGARQAWLDMNALGADPPVPAVLRRFAQWMISRGFESWRPFVVEARSDTAARRSVEELMRRADDLTPALRASNVPDSLKSVRWAAILPDGRTEAFLSWEGQAGLLEPDGSKAASLPLGLARVNNQRNLAFSGDGTVTACEMPGSVVQVQCVAGGGAEPTHLIHLDAVFSPADFQPRPPPSTGGQAIRETFVVGGSNARPQLAGLALNRDGTRLVLIAQGGVARLLSLGEGGRAEPLHAAWRMESPEIIDYMRMRRWVLDAAGNQLAATPSTILMHHAPVLVWNALDGSVLARGALIHEDQVNELAFSPDAKELAAGVENGAVMIWEIASGGLVRSLDVGSAVSSLAYGPSASEGFLLVGAMNYARVFDVGTRREVARVPQTGRVDAVAWSPDGHVLLTGGSTEAKNVPLRLWDFDAARNVAPARMRAVNSLSGLSCAAGVVAAVEWPSGLHVWQARSGETLGWNEHAGILRLATAIDGDARTVLTLAPLGHEDSVAWRFDWTGGGRTSVTVPGSSPGTNDGRSFIGYAGCDGRGKRLLRLATLDRDQPPVLELWDVESSGRLWQKTPVPGLVGLALSPDGKRAAWIDNGGKISSLPAREDDGKAWETAAHNRPTPGQLGGLAFSGNSKKLAAFVFREVRLYDAATGAPVGAAIRFEKDVRTLALDDDGGRVVTTLVDRQLVVANAGSGEIVSSLPFDSSTPGGSLVLSREDRSIYAVFQDDNVNDPRVWRWRLELDDVAAALSDRLPKILELDPVPGRK